MTMENPAVLFTYFSLGALAVIPIVIGSLSSVMDEVSKEKENLSANDAYSFPIIGSCCLLGLYLVVKYLEPVYLSLLITAYFSIFGCISVAKLTIRTLSFIPALKATIDSFAKFHLSFKREEEQVISLSFSLFDVGIFVASAAFTVLYTLNKHWIMNNEFGEAYSTTAITLIGLESFSVGLIMLAGLFFYDIFWVFGTNVMVKVAKNLDAPIKLLFPKNIFSYSAQAKGDFALLGLGDIVVPGIFIALCLKFDHFLAGKRGKTALMNGDFSFAKPYFISGLIAYAIGLTTTIVVMHTFKAAQPALLYLSPACGLAPLITALMRGELGELFAFSLAPPSTEEAAKVAEGKKD
jgi:minor histocompatibility antigen H13